MTTNPVRAIAITTLDMGRPTGHSFVLVADPAVPRGTAIITTSRHTPRHANWSRGYDAPSCAFSIYRDTAGRHRRYTLRAGAIRGIR